MACRQKLIIGWSAVCRLDSNGLSLLRSGSSAGSDKPAPTSLSEELPALQVGLTVFDAAQIEVLQRHATVLLDMLTQQGVDVAPTRDKLQAIPDHVCALSPTTMTAR